MTSPEPFYNVTGAGISSSILRLYELLLLEHLHNNYRRTKTFTFYKLITSAGDYIFLSVLCAFT